jgi:hypothetical protein
MVKHKNRSLSEKMGFLVPVYIENLAFFSMPFLDFAFLDIHSIEMILIYGMMLPWFYVMEISINSIVILVSGEEISRRAESGQFFKKRIQLATFIVIFVTGPITIIAAAVTTHVIAPMQFWTIFPYFVVFTIGFAVYALRKMAAIEVTSLGNPRAALKGAVLAVGVNLLLNVLAQQTLDTTSLLYVLAIALSTITAYMISWIYIRSTVVTGEYSEIDQGDDLYGTLESLIPPMKTQLTSTLELISSQSYSLIVIMLLFSVNSEFVYVRSFLVQFFLVVTATGIAMSIYCNNTISERMAEGAIAVQTEINQDIDDILKASFVQSLVVVCAVYALFRFGVFGRELSEVGLQSLVIGALIYMIYEPVKATNIMLLTVIRRLHIAALPTTISIASNFVAVCCAIFATWIIDAKILTFAMLISIVLVDEVFRYSFYNWYVKTTLNRGLAHD